MANLFNVPKNFKDGDTSLFLTPKNGNGHIDVLRDYEWTLSNKASREDITPCYLWEYQPNNAQLINALQFWAYQIRNDLLQDLGLNPILEAFTSQIGALKTIVDSVATVNPNRNPIIDMYTKRYVAKKTGFEYILPYLGQDGPAVSNTFQADTLLANFDKVKSLIIDNKPLAGKDGEPNGKSRLQNLGLIGNVIQGGVEMFSSYKPKVLTTESWNTTSAKTAQIDFDLINNNSVEDAVKNWEFCFLLSYQNHPSQRNALLAESPCIYTLYIPNKSYLPVCYINSFVVKDLGQTRMMQCSDGKTRSIPEAYRISISFTGIVNPYSRNILASLDEDTLNLPKTFVHVITQKEESDRFNNKLADFLINTNKETGKLLQDLTSITPPVP